MIRWLAFCVALLAPALPGAASAEPPAASPNTLDGLLARCAHSPGLLAQFTEEKQIALLAAPLRSEGTVHFAPDRGLARHVRKPAPQSVLVTDRDLAFWDGKQVKRMSLASSPTLETFARAFAMILTANRAELEKSFALDFQPSGADGYTLRLAPTGAELKKMLAGITVTGHGLTVESLVVREANGDVSTTRFTSVDPRKTYTAAEADRLFRVPPG